MSNETRPLPIVYCGMRCPFSGPPLAALLAAGHDVRALVLPGPPFGPPIVRHTTTRSLPLAGKESDDDIEEIARRAGVPILSTRDPGHPEAIAAVSALHPAVIAVACFPHRLPRKLLDLPPLGCLNVHPSLLPKGRGPEPIFWTLRRGISVTGTTIHLIDERFDAGPIVRQEAIPVAEGIRAPQLEQRLAALGGRLLVDAIARLTVGTAAPAAQDDAAATRAPRPTDADYLVPTAWPAQRAFAFVRGVAPLGGPLILRIQATTEHVPILDALTYSPDRRIDRPFILHRDCIEVQFEPGAAIFRLRP